MRRRILAVIWCLALASCTHKEPAPIKPAPPLAADPDVQLATMQIECDGMIAALTVYKACTNHDPNDVDNVEAWIERANRDFAASRKANPEPNAQKAIAAACHKATDSVKAATQRCAAGKPPRVD